jgi:hypothetical protein
MHNPSSAVVTFEVTSPCRNTVAVKASIKDHIAIKEKPMHDEMELPLSDGPQQMCWTLLITALRGLLLACIVICDDQRPHCRACHGSGRPEAAQAVDRADMCCCLVYRAQQPSLGLGIASIMIKEHFQFFVQFCNMVTQMVLQTVIKLDKVTTTALFGWQLPTEI